jgi:RNA polymerase sigma-70 factor (ECF subfamily)
MSEARDWCLERYQPLLRLQARQLCLNPRLKRLFDSSDLVQDTYARAVAKLHQFQGTTEAELVKWLQVILKRIFLDKIDEHKQELGHLHLGNMVEESTARLEEYLQANQTSPTQQVERQERLMKLAEAIDQLPEDQRDVIICHHLHALPVAEIAQNLGRSEKAVAGLLYRAKKQLHELLVKLR